MAIKLEDWMKQDPYGNGTYTATVKKLDNDWSSIINSFNDLYMNDTIKQQVLDTWSRENVFGDKQVESDEDKVARILKGDFEKKFGMTFEKFIEVYHRMLENNPEKLI